MLSSMNPACKGHINHLKTLPKTEDANRLQQHQDKMLSASQIIERLNLLRLLCSDNGCSQEALLDCFNALPEKIKEFMRLSLWVAHNRPTHDVQYGTHEIERDTRQLVSCVNNHGQSILDQLIAHYENRRLGDLKIVSLLNHCRSLDKNNKRAFTNLPIELNASIRQPGLQKRVRKNPQLLRNAIDSTIERINTSIRGKLSEASHQLQSPTKEKKCNESVKASRLADQYGRGVLQKDVSPLFIAAECSPMVKQGGLAEAVSGMAKGLAKKNRRNKVRVILPYYDHISDDIKKQMKEKPKYAVNDRFSSGKINRVFKAKIDNVRYYFIEDSGKDQETSRFGIKKSGKAQSIYGPDNDAVKERFAYFSSCAESLAYQLKNKIDVVHLHDWHTAPVANLIARRHPDEWKKGVLPPVVFTYHNNNPAAQGIYEDSNSVAYLKQAGIEQPGMNGLVQAMRDSDAVTTVSEKFAHESKSKHLGAGIEKAVGESAKRDKLIGILNGSNTDVWNPETDQQLRYWKDPENGQQIDLRYGPSDDLVAKKALIREQLQKWLKVHRPDVAIDFSKPLVTFIGRYDSSQKGLNLFEAAMKSTIDSGGQFIAMGSQEDEKASLLLDRLEQQAGNRPGAFIIRDSKGPDGRYITQMGSLGSQGIGSLIRAATDFVFIPSEFEPCGYIQSEGGAFGAKAIATDTGGLSDSIAVDGPNKNGYLFDRLENFHSEAQKQKAADVIVRALMEHKTLGKKQRNHEMRRMMKQWRKTSWNDAARDRLSPVDRYLLTYRHAQEQARLRGTAYVDCGLLKA